jgi:hypothetical protein
VAFIVRFGLLCSRIAQNVMCLTFKFFLTVLCDNGVMTGLWGTSESAVRFTLYKVRNILQWSFLLSEIISARVIQPWVHVLARIQGCLLQVQSKEAKGKRAGRRWLGSKFSICTY